MKFFHLWAPAQFLRLVKTPKGISNIKILDDFFRTRDKNPPQLLKSLVVNMPKRVFEVNCEKLTLHYISRPCVSEKLSISNDFPWFSYEGFIILSRRNSDFFGYVPPHLIKTDEHYVHPLVEYSCIFFTLWMTFR